MGIWRGLALAAGLMASAAGSHGEARYLGNDGILVSRGQTKILFDAFYAESFDGRYALVPDAMEQAMMAGTAPFDGVDAIFISHIHPDHFNSRKTIAYLRAHPNVRLYAGLDVVGAIRAADASSDPLMQRVVAIHVPVGGKPASYSLDGLEIEAFSIPHNGNGPIPHYAFRVTLDSATTVMHLGDAGDIDAHYLPYQADFDAKRTDAAFAPIWLLASDSGRRVLEQRIRAVKTIGIHADEPLRADPGKAKAELKGDVFLQPGESRAIGETPR